MTVPTNFGDFQNPVYADAVRGVNSRFPFDFATIERKASEALPDWVYRYVSAASGDGRTQRANIAAYSHYGIVPRMMVSPPERDLRVRQESDASLNAAAEALVCHPNTVRYRLRRIEQRTGRSLSRPRDVAELCLAFEVHRRLM
jgi:isopentenyl diphosphate isomerase/L-lactate dehydrogenase-like FMN-dependent dehydrogenase